jgi:ribosomal protein S18 acetylase RimI-like enzyme
MILRRAVPIDAEAIARIYISARKKFIPFAPMMHSEEGIYHWILDILIPTNQVIVAEENDIVVGMMVLSKKEHVGWIDQLYLSPSVINRGIGTLLLTEAKSILGSPIHLHTFQENSDARRFYERHGFKALEFSDGSKNEEKCPDILYKWKSSV